MISCIEMREFVNWDASFRESGAQHFPPKRVRHIVRIRVHKDINAARGREATPALMWGSRVETQREGDNRRHPQALDKIG